MSLILTNCMGSQSNTFLTIALNPNKKGFTVELSLELGKEDLIKASANANANAQCLIHLNKTLVSNALFE
jgi:hypothetical protein